MGEGDKGKKTGQPGVVGVGGRQREKVRGEVWGEAV
jgi:hypothetical protein